MSKHNKKNSNKFYNINMQKKSEKPIKVYTDGACINNGFKENVGGFGFVVIKNDIRVDEYVETEYNTTNNRQELKAIVAALDYLIDNDIDSFTIYSDNQYCVKGISDWMFKWQKNGWKLIDGGDVKNIDLWDQAFFLCKKIGKVDIRWVKGHNGNKWNEYIDELIQIQVNKKYMTWKENKKNRSSLKTHSPMNL